MTISPTYDFSTLGSCLPTLNTLGDLLLVPFAVARCRHPRVLWINSRWLRASGYHFPDSVDARVQVERWLLTNFAFTAIAKDKVKSPSSTTAYADCYGDLSGYSPHGGSGRVGTIGQYQIKGIGPTPLVGRAAEMHSHGMVSLEEAVWETIFSEICDAELPFGAVPVIAIIDTGELISNSLEADQPSRRVLIVRPSVIRAAHLLRAPMFMPLDPSQSFPPGRDARRTYAAIQHVAAIGEQDRVRLSLPRSLLEYCDRLALQAATADALRLFTGGLFPGNISLTGAVMDFGVARALPTWARHRTHAHADGFGADIARISEMADALLYYARKGNSSNTKWFSDRPTPTAISTAYEAGLRTALVQLWAGSLLDSYSQTEIGSLMYKYFANQQRIRTRERWIKSDTKNLPWLGTTLALADVPAGELVSSPEVVVAFAIQSILRQAKTSLVDPVAHCWQSASRMLDGRSSLDRFHVADVVSQIERNTRDSTEHCELISALIRRTVSQSRRFWPSCPPEYSIRSQRVNDGCSLLEVTSGISNLTRFWVEGQIIDGRCCWLGNAVSRSQLDRWQPTLGHKKWHCLVDDLQSLAPIRDLLSQPADTSYNVAFKWWEK